MFPVIRGALLFFAALSVVHAQVGIKFDEILNEPSGGAAGLSTQLRAISDSRRQAVIDRGEQAIAQLQKWGQVYDELGTTLQELLNSEAGRSIAVDPNLVGRFITLSQQHNRSNTNVRLIIDRINTLLAPLRSDASSSDYQISEQYRQQLNAEIDEAMEITTGYEALRNQVQDLLAAGMAPLPSTPTLKEAVNQQRRERAVADAIRQARREQQAWERRQAELDYAAQTMLDAELARMRRGTERSALRMKAEDPAIQSLFAPFLAEGTKDVNLGFWAIRPPGPVSIKALSSRKALNRVDVFVKIAITGIGGRPTWPRPGKDDWDEMERRMNLFRELAPIWVEMGLLRP